MLWQRAFMEAVLVGVVALAAAMDLRYRRLPNWLSGALLVSGMALSLTPVHLVSFEQALLGAAVGLAVPLALHILGGLAAGDVKLLCGVGAWVAARGIAGVCRRSAGGTGAGLDSGAVAGADAVTAAEHGSCGAECDQLAAART